MNQFLTQFTRQILKNKIYAIINFFGLSIGVALALLIFIFVREEVSYDNFHENSSRIYRMNYALPQQDIILASSPPPIAPRLTEFFSEIDKTARVYSRNISVKPSSSQVVYEETEVIFADTTFTSIFTLDFINGNPATALSEGNIIITDEMANKYFGTTDVIGNSLKFANRLELTVSGVVRHFPANSHMSFNMLGAYENMYDLESPAVGQAMKNNLSANFMISHSYTYVMLKEGSSPEAFNEGIYGVIKKIAPENMHIGQVFTLMPIEDIHLTSEAAAEMTPANSWSTLYLFIAVGLLTLIIASINYTNLATAQSFSRIKEIGIRKALGSSNRFLLIQFLLETFLFVMASIFIAYCIFYLALPLLNDVTGKSFEFNTEMDLQLMLLSLGLAMFLTLLAGAYPAIFVTGFNVVTALKGKKLQATQGGKLLRKSLVTFQLIVASFLLVCTMIVFSQLDFLINRSLGFNKDRVVMINLSSQNLNNIFSLPDSTFNVRLDSYAKQISANAFVYSTSKMDTYLGIGSVYRGAIPEGFTADDNMFVANISVDYNFIDAFDIQLLSGRNFNINNASDISQAFIVNETAVKTFNWSTPEEAIGKTILIDGREGTVIGVVNDFHFTGLTRPIEPLSIQLNRRVPPYLAVKLAGSDTESAIKQLESEWQGMFQEKPFDYTLLDDSIQSQYEDFSNFGRIIKYFSVIAIAIACLGLYGMILYSTQNKLKEIGIRKVLGASVPLILKSFFIEFGVLIIIAFIIAIPLINFLANNWLSDFQYRIEIGAITYIIGLTIVVLITIITIGFNAAKAAMVNPVETLRNE